ncbi:hypothetical protein PQQ75_35570 [Paraburkholderia aspalathi]|uniref:hypothetical protein n=1 Tax=Paraburkholderia aspalathi TaxID=1324617 RepID=UPI0038B841F5
MLVAISMLAGGGIAGALGYNVQGATTAAENETLNNYLDHRQTTNLVASLQGCAPGDTACINQTASNYQSVSTQQQQAAQNCNSVTGCAEVKNDALSGYGISASDAQSDCQGSATCVSFLTGLGNRDVSAKAIATTNWNDVSTAVYAQNAQQALISSGFSPTTAAVLSAATPMDAAGATESITGSNSGGSSFWSSTGSSTAVENAYGHWDKHMSEFPEYQNSVQYVQGAQDFVSDPPAGTLTKTHPNGDTLLYDPSTNTFAVRTVNGAPRTMFRPQGGMSYWNKQ